MGGFSLKLSVFWLLLCLCATAQSASEQLERIIDREWTALLQRSPELAVYLGRPTEKLWGDRSAQARAASNQRYLQTLRELEQIDESDLTSAQRTNKGLFAQQLGWQVERHQLGLDLFTMNQRDGLHTAATMADSINFRTLGDLELWVRRLEAFGDLADREVDVLKEAVERGRVHPRVITERLVEQVSAQVRLAQNPAESAFLKPFKVASPQLRAERDFPILQQRGEKAVRQVIGPAFERLSNYLSGPYLQASPQRVGLSQLPQGDLAYAFLIRRYTTTQLPAEEIHSLGLSEVARIRAEMEAIREEVRFEGSLEEFFTHLRTDPTHYVQDPAELLRRYRAFCKHVDGKMPLFFKTLPRKPYGVEAIPDYIAPATTTAYYMPGAGSLAGTYCVNLYQPETRALFEIPSLSMHEAVPGHHHQIALAAELPELPDFRRYSDGFGDYTVFVEGWALYAESLGQEMGLYQTPYERFGQLTYEIWRAIRLVLDTGIHSQGWSQEKAIAYFLANSPRSELDITNEVDRYIAWPGQALAYKMGELKISELRRWASQELGPKFDLREFHDAVLLQGAVPLDQLERQVKEYVARSR